MNLLRFFLGFYFFSFTLLNFAQEGEVYSKKINYDAKIYKILIKELKVAEKLQNSNPSTANDFRVFTTRTEILKILKTKNVEDSLKNPNSSQVKKDNDIIQKFYEKTKQLGFKIEKNKKFSELYKFYFIFGLSIYEFEDSNDLVPHYLKMALDGLSDKELKHICASKLGDFYFNKSSFKLSAQYYYQAIVIDKNSDWRFRHLHNLAWCYFKLENYDKAISTMNSLYNRAKKEHQTKDYYYQQSVQKIPVFYLYNNDAKSGFNFVKKNSGVLGDEIIQYLKSVYDKGFFDDLDIMVANVESDLKQQNKSEELLNFRLSMYNHVATKEFKKNFLMLKRLRSGIATSFLDPINAAKSEQKQSFIEDNKSLLNEDLQQINRKEFDPKKNAEDKATSDDASDILSILLKIDAKNSVSYRLKLAQLYKKTSRSEEALKMLWDDYQKYGGVDNPEAEPHLIEILGVAELLKDKKTSFELEKPYQDYLKIGKDKKIRSVVYLKYFDLKFNEGKSQECLAIIKQHQKEYPGPNEDRSKMVAKLLNEALKQKDKKLFDAIRVHAMQDPAVKNNASLMKTLNTGHNTFLLEKVNAMLADNKSDKAIAAQKLASIFHSNAIDRPNQLVSGFNAGLLFAGIGMFSESQGIMTELVDSTNKNEFLDYHEKVANVTQNSLVAGNENYAKFMYLKLYQKSCALKIEKNNSYALTLLELYLSSKEYSQIKNLFATVKPCQWNDQVKSDALSLLNDYLSWQEESVAQNIMSLLAQQQVNTMSEVEKNLEQYFIWKVNQVNILSTKSSFVFLQEVENFATKSLSLSSDFVRDGKVLFQLSFRLNPLVTERINARNFSPFVEKNLDAFTKNLALISQIKPKYASIIHLKQMLEFQVMTQFVSFFKTIDPLIDDQKNKSIYLEQISEVLKPIEEKIVEFEVKYKAFLKTENSIIKHYSFDDEKFLRADELDLIWADRL